MYYVNKIVGWMLSPLGVFFLGLALGVLLHRFGRCKRSGRLVIVLAIAQLWIFSCGVTTRLIGVPLEGAESVLPCEALPKADAIVLLGGGMGVHNRCARPEILAGADRAWMASRVFKAGKAPLLTVSGGGAPGEIAFLSDMGVDTNCIVSLEAARNTEEESRLIRARIASVKGECAGPATILLVTSAWHMPRAKMLFERAGFSVVPVPTDYEMNFVGENPWQLGDFMPNPDALVRNSAAIKEWVARFCYALKGGGR